MTDQVTMPGQEPKKGMSRGCLVALIVGAVIIVLAGIGMVAPDLVSYWRDRHTIANNGLSFVLNFKNQYA